MSRVQLALRVADLDAAVDFYSRLFDTAPAKRRPGYANFAIAEPPLKLVLLEGEPGEPTRMDHLGVEVPTTDEVTAATAPARRRRSRDAGRGQHHLLLRRPGQGLGDRPRRGAVGGLHRDRRRPPRPRGRGPTSSSPPSPVTARCCTPEGSDTDARVAATCC